jgi:intracellular multiplication protein IcmK
MRIRKTLIIKLSVMLALFGGAEAFAQEGQESAQQALQQLKMLQQRMGGDSKKPTANQNNSGSLAVLAPKANSENAAVVESPAPQANVLATIPLPPKSDAELIEEKAYETMTSQLFPLSPEQLIQLKQQYQTNQYAQNSPVGTPPKPTATSQIVDLSPGSTPPVIRLSQGFVSSLVFLDSTGAPWPISAYDLGDPASFNIQWDKKSNTLMIQALKLYNYGNLAVRLKDLNTPVMLTLIPGQKAVDYRVDLRIQGYGPNADRTPMQEGLPPAANDVLLRVLDGVPPSASSRLTISGGDAQGWLSGDKMYIRTNLTILSPGWLASMTSADGKHAYELQKAPVLLVSWHGKVMQLKVEGL